MNYLYLLGKQYVVLLTFSRLLTILNETETKSTVTDTVVYGSPGSDKPIAPPVSVTVFSNLHLTVESYRVVMLLTVILNIISLPSPTHSFIPGLKPFSANRSHRCPSFFFGIH